LCSIGCKPEVKKDIPLVQTLISPVGYNSSLPFLYSNADRTLLSWMEKINDSVTELRYAELKDGVWQSPQRILQGSDWFVNWADFPAIAENKGSLISHILKKSSVGTYSYDVKLNVLPVDKKQWINNLTLHTDATPTEHGFVSILPYNEGFFIAWLDGRNTAEDENGNRGAMTLRAAEVAINGEITNEVELDNRICDCCQTTAVITPNGPAIMYRDRSDDEVRDMSIVRWKNGSWTAPKTVHADNWKIKGRPVNGPKASILMNTLVMTWFTGANEKPKVQVVFSTDGGANFNSPILVSEAHPMGRVDVLQLNEQEALVSWMESKEGTAQLKAVKVNRDGNLGVVQIIAGIEASRQSGFPQMEQVGDKIYFAWTEIDKTKSQVKTALVQANKF